MSFNSPSYYNDTGYSSEAVDDALRLRAISTCVKGYEDLINCYFDELTPRLQKLRADKFRDGLISFAPGILLLALYFLHILPLENDSDVELASRLFCGALVLPTLWLISNFIGSELARVKRLHRDVETTIAYVRKQIDAKADPSDYISVVYEMHTKLARVEPELLRAVDARRTSSVEPGSYEEYATVLPTFTLPSTRTTLPQATIAVEQESHVTNKRVVTYKQ